MASGSEADFQEAKVQELDRLKSRGGKDLSRVIWPPESREVGQSGSAVRLDDNNSSID